MDQNNSSIFPTSSTTPLRVAFDSSVLGYSRYGAGGRTGVFRMADNLARGLARSADCELSFCPGENFRMWVAAQEYLATDAVLSKVPRLSYGSPARVYGFLGRWFWELAKEERIAWPARVARRALADSLRAVERSFEPLDPRELRGRNIFYSSFYPLPAATRGVPNLRRFLAVCDLINIQSPQFSSDGGAYLKEILATLEPDDFAIAISQSTKNDLCRYRPDLDPDRVTVVPLAASDAFRPVKTSSPERPYFLSVCTLDKRKNLDGLVRAFGEWVKQQAISEVDLVLVGSLGDAASTVREQVKQAGLPSDRVKLLGYVADEDLAPLYSGALGFVYPSFYEGFGLPVVEAMQCGTPTITSHGSSLEEIAAGAARLVDPHRTDDLAAALDSFYRNSFEREALRAAGLKRAAHFSWENSTRTLLSAYRRAL